MGADGEGGCLIEGGLLMTIPQEIGLQTYERRLMYTQR